MPRPTKTPNQRADDVKRAAASLPMALDAAASASIQYGYDSPESKAAWAHVEEYGATIHRNGRLLAGKSKGG